MSSTQFLGVPISELMKLQKIFGAFDSQPEAGFYIELHYAIAFVNQDELSEEKLDSLKEPTYNQELHDTVRDNIILNSKYHFIENEHYVNRNGVIFFNVYGFKFFCMSLSDYPLNGYIKTYFLMVEGQLEACKERIEELNSRISRSNSSTRVNTHIQEK